jgi:hypothetical protein
LRDPKFFPRELLEDIEEEVLDVLVAPFVVTLEPGDEEVAALPEDLRQFIIIGVEAHGAKLAPLCPAARSDQSDRLCFIQ